MAALVLAIVGVCLLTCPQMLRPQGHLFSADTNLDRLLNAINDGDAQKVRALLVGRVSPNARDGRGLSPLAHAALLGGHQSTVIVRLLLEHGAVVDARDHLGNTALVSALLMGNSEVAALLIRAGADPSAGNAFGMSALHVAADCPDSATLIPLLLRAGANPLVLDHEGRTALDYARDAGNDGAGRILEELASAPTDDHLATAASRPQAHTGDLSALGR